MVGNYIGHGQCVTATTDHDQPELFETGSTLVSKTELRTAMRDIKDDR